MSYSIIVFKGKLSMSISPITQFIQHLNQALLEESSPDKVHAIIEMNTNRIDAEVNLRRAIKMRMEKEFESDSVQQLLKESFINISVFKKDYCQRKPICASYDAIEKAWKAKEIGQSVLLKTNHQIKHTQKNRCSIL